ncbi:IS66 family insertion sequence element accessory protein TnpB [Pseudomonas syringae]|uniref:ISPsy5, transposase n=1 Tax=Pseudomonas syringae pv. aceris TaxID=199198 RepID=A0A0P9KBH1_PSESX|nr:IS66 family insertion sequence element accessory protein TnpB [Pseudomonas syringae]EGH69567.1 ISPsy5, transposase [Pseudomonas syringae pv. aceris str. M302273]KPW26317.1 ISPsy5, transposase [Pseudomonas syringae pv. aceris]MCH5513336.1 IS66 family insertion sequence element accessory protein TnpB [Pseudomonas syringae pv. syringae]MCH5557134.1 IS66 family insertion sequence element accessory protein TnpB [Pseudomonas syringae pv. syringae]MCH5577320.1 IS66 family insertion sequence elemen
MMRPDAKVEKVYLYPKPVDFRKSIDGLAVLVELDIRVAVFDPVLFVFLSKIILSKCQSSIARLTVNGVADENARSPLI